MTAVDRARVHGVLLLLLDGPEDVVAARYAAAVAADAGTRVLAVVVLPGERPTLDDALIAAGTVRRRQEAAAVAGRVQPVTDAHDVALTAVPLLLPSGRSGWTRRRLRQALRLLVRCSAAELVVVPPRPVLGVPPEEVARLVRRGVVAPAPEQAPRVAAGVGT